MKDIKIGDVVKLKSGGIIMTVEEIYDDNQVGVVFDDGKNGIARNKIDSRALEIIS